MIPYPAWLNAGDNAWQLTAATLVGLMSIPGLAILFGNYGMPGTTLAAEWRPLEQVTHDPDLVRLDVQHGVPIYAYRRLATYARWHPLHVTTHSLGWWPSFAIERGDQVWRDLVRWERTHPSLLSYTPVA